MADISKIKLPNGSEYNIKDEVARANSGVTGVKGNAESSYRTGNVNLTAANVGAYRVGAYVSHRNPDNISANPANVILTTDKNALDYQVLRTVAGVGDWFYALHNNPDYTVTCNYSGRHGTKGNFTISTLFYPSAASTVLLDKDVVSATPFVLTIQKNSGVITATDVVHLELFGHTLVDTGSYMTDYKVELYTTGSTSSSGTYSWQTVYERHGVKDRPHGLAITLNPTTYSYLYFSGLRFTISGIGGVSSNTSAWNYNCLDISLFRLMDQRPAFSAARSIGALDINGGDVYGVANFRNGLTGNVTGTASKATADASGNTITSYYAPKSTTVTNVALATNKITKTINGSTTDVVGAASTSTYGITKLNTATNSTSTTEAATPSAVKTAYDLADQANGTANTALSGVNGSYIYDHTFTIANGVATFTPHVYLKGAEVTSTFAASCFVWKYRLIDGSEVTLTTKSDRGCDVTITSMGYGGHVIGAFTPPA